MFLVISVYFNLRNILPKSGTFPPGHPVYEVNIFSKLTLVCVYIYIYIYMICKYVGTTKITFLQFVDLITNNTVLYST